MYIPDIFKSSKLIILIPQLHFSTTTGVFFKGRTSIFKIFFVPDTGVSWFLKTFVSAKKNLYP